MLKDITEIKSHQTTKDIEKYRFIHNFIPHEHHKRRARLLTHKWFIFYIIGLVVIFTLFRTVPKLFPGVLGYASNIKIADLLELTNKKRDDAGLNDLKINPELSKAAEEKAKDMFKNNYWAHVSPDGKEPWDFILAQDYDYSYAGENLAKNFNSSKEVVEAWVKSPSHKENLLSKNYDEIGFAVVDGVLDGYKTTLVVQMFGRPRNPSYLANTNPQPEKNEITPQAAVASAGQAQEEANKLGVQTSPVVVSPAYAYPFLLDVSHATKIIGVAFGGFIGSLFGVDLWYSKRKGIPKFTGHTLAHFMVLVVIILGIWFVLAPGRIM